MNKPHKLGFYITPEHACSYLTNRQAITLFADPHFSMNRHIYTQLAQKGFRRSGEYIYKPYCDRCNACIPVRVPVNAFVMRKRHRRIWNNNRDLTVRLCSADYDEFHFNLYRKYLNRKHPGGGMDNPDRKDYTGFLSSCWMDTMFYELKLDDQLLAIAVTDRLDDGLSAVYTFYDPDFSKRSLGIYSVLYEIQEAKRMGLDWLYLGYWIAECGKMNYKDQFQPLEYLYDNRWIRDPA